MDHFSNKYEFPAHHSWPFFYTIQKHAETRMKQLDMWANILKEFCKKNKLWKISKVFFIENIGKNTVINRKLSTESTNLLFDYFIKTNACLASGNDLFFVLWRGLDEWMQIIYDSVIKHHRVDSLETLDYLMYDEEVANEEYHGIDKDLLVGILKELEKRNRCLLLQDDQGAFMGVKFMKV